MKTVRLFSVILLMIILFSGCGGPMQKNVVPAGAEVSENMREHMEERCEEIVLMCWESYVNAEKVQTGDNWQEELLTQNSVDAMEDILSEAEIAVMDTDDKYPAYLTAGDRLHSFLDKVECGEPTEHEVITILESGALLYKLFAYEGENIYLHTMHYPFTETGEAQYEKYKVLDWEMTDRGNFYYQIYPAGDKHYEDYTLIRTVPPDKELYDLNLRYISPAGYIAANIFLQDWTEGFWNGLSFNDLWDHFYYAYHGEQYQGNEEMTAGASGYYLIPAEEFEEVVFPYFNIDLDTFRGMAQYDEEKNGYPWRPLETNDFVFLWYYICEPEVTSCNRNPDGTISLSVEMISTDLKTDCLFAHEVTVRPLENGGFQYVGNKVTYQSEYGLPYCKPRLYW